MSDPGAQTVALGRISKPQGLHGELRLKLYNPDSDLLWTHNTWILEHDGETRSAQAHRVRMVSADVAVVAIEGVRGRNEAEQYRGWEVALPLSALPEVGEEEWYVRDLLGLQVLSTEGESVGRVADTLSYPSVDCLIVDTEKGRYEVPMVDPYLQSVDIAGGKVVVDRLGDLDPVSKGPVPQKKGKA